jgi:hypothetical protein
MMSEEDKLGEVRIKNITDREDGGSDIEVDLDEKVAVTMAQLGLEITLYCAAYKVDFQDVLDWISSHKLGDENE